MEHRLTEVERRLKEQLPFLTAATKMLQDAGKDPKDAELEPFLQMVHDMKETLSNVLGPVIDESGSELQATANELWHLTRFVAHGLRTYRVSPGLAELLAKTNISRIQMKWLRLPFPSFYIELPPEAETYMYSLDGCRYPILGVLVTSVRMAVTGEIYLSLAFTAGNSPEAAKDINSVTFSLHIPFEEHTLADAMTEVANRMADLLGEGKLRLTLVTDRFKTWKQFLVQYRKDLGRLVNLVANTLLYATCDNPEVTIVRSPRSVLEKKLPKLGPKKRSRLQRQCARVSGLEQRLLGGSIVIERGEREDAEYATNTGRCVMVRHMVSGHWRHQACGPNKELRRWTWIAPHYRGPEGSEEIVRKHLLR